MTILGESLFHCASCAYRDFLEKSPGSGCARWSPTSPTAPHCSRDERGEVRRMSRPSSSGRSVIRRHPDRAAYPVVPATHEAR